MPPLGATLAFLASIASPWLPARSLRGADVFLEGAAEERGARARGRLVDVVVGTGDGRVASYLVSVGELIGGEEKIVLVPAASLRLAVREDVPLGLLRSTEAQLRSQPAFNVERARKEGLDAALGQAPDPADAREVPRFLFSTQIEGTRVRAGADLFGRVSDAALDLGRGSVAYLIVSPRGSVEDASGAAEDDRIVPYAACRWLHSERGNLLGLDRTAAELEEAPRWARPESGFLAPDAARRAEAFFARREPARTN